MPRGGSPVRPTRAGKRSPTPTTRAGHLLSVSSPAGTTSYSYSTDSNPLVQNALTQVTNPDGTTQSFGYDSQGDLSSQSGPGGVGTTTYSYGATGIVTETDPAGNATTLVTTPTETWSRTIDPSGNVTNLQYDSNGDLTGVTSPGGGSDQFSYDANGNLVSYTGPGRRCGDGDLCTGHRRADVADRPERQHNPVQL